MKYIKHLVWLLVAAFLAGPALAAEISASGAITTQNISTSETCTAASCVELDITNRGTVSVQVAGTYTGALTLQRSNNRLTWTTVSASTTFTNGAGTQTGTIGSSVTGAFAVANVAGFKWIRITALAPVTGTATVTIYTSIPGGGGGGGGGGGAVTISDGSDAALGAQADAAAAADTSTASLISLTKRNNQNLTTLNTSVTADPNYSQTPNSAAPSRALQVAGTDGTNTVVPRYDPCQTGARTYYPVDIVTATTTRFSTPTASQKTYICSIFLYSAGTQNVAVIEGTGGTCGTGAAGLMGGATAAEGQQLTAQTGFLIPNTGWAHAASAGTNVDVCLITSAAVQLSGSIVFVKAP